MTGGKLESIFVMPCNVVVGLSASFTIASGNLECRPVLRQPQPPQPQPDTSLRVLIILKNSHIPTVFFFVVFFQLFSHFQSNSELLLDDAGQSQWRAAGLQRLTEPRRSTYHQAAGSHLSQRFAKKQTALAPTKPRRGKKAAGRLSIR